MNNEFSHLHPESISFMIYCSKENSIVHFSPCEQCLKSFASGKYLFHDVELKRKFYSPKFVLLVNNAIIHLHPESICFIMYYSKENFIVIFFPCEHCPKSFASRMYLLHDVILKRKLYSPKFLFLVNNALPMSWFDPDSILFSLYDSNISNRINLWFVHRISHWSNLWFVLEAWITKLCTCLAPPQPPMPYEKAGDFSAKIMIKLKERRQIKIQKTPQ